MSFTSAIVPVLIAFISLHGILKKVDIYSALTSGAARGLEIIKRILPSVIIMLTAVHMFRASGALDALAAALAPVTRFFGIPPETLPLILIRPISGSGALAVGADLIWQYGADSLVGRTAAVMLGSTETTFYTISTYFGSLGIKKTRYAVPAALIADLTGFLAASLSVKLFF